MSYKEQINEPWYEKAWAIIYYPLYRLFYREIWERIRPGALKHYYQRARYGYSYQDCWSIDWHLSNIIPKMLKQMKGNLNGCPSEIAEKWRKEDKDDVHMTHAMKDWEGKLDTIQKAFELEYELLDGTLYNCTTKTQERRMKKLMQTTGHFEGCRIMTLKEKTTRDKGWKLFRQYFSNLWD